MNLSIYTILASFLILSACSSSPKSIEATRGVASQSQPGQLILDQPVPEQGEVWGQEEMQIAEKVLAQNQDALVARTADSATVPRDAHPKHHGCVAANFKVDASKLPTALRVGVFAPGAKPSYDAWIRFSNGDPGGVDAPDLTRDVRGMAVKLMNVSDAHGGSQDFVMISGKEFFSKNSKDYLVFHEAILKGKVAIGEHFLAHPFEAIALNNAVMTPGNPLLTKYYSSVPYKLAAKSMKFKAEPCSTMPKDAKPDSASTKNYLSEKLIGSLKSKSACFDFFVQPNMEPETNEIENPIHTWNEKKSPYIKVATITINKQTGIDSPEQKNFCENITFDPWHSHPELRPMGQINRTRLVVYNAIAKLRHDQNQTTIVEPTSLNACAGANAPLCNSPNHKK